MATFDRPPEVFLRPRKTIGKLYARCTATASAKATDPNAFIEAHFICEDSARH